MTVAEITTRAGDEAARNVQANIRLLKRLLTVSDDDLAEAVGKSRSAFQARLSGRTRLSIAELGAIASYFSERCGEMIPVTFFMCEPTRALGELERLGVTPNLVQNWKMMSGDETVEPGGPPFQPGGWADAPEPAAA